MNNLERYKKDIEDLSIRGDGLVYALFRDTSPKEFETQMAEVSAERAELFKKLPSFARAYQGWYSEAKALIRQLLPDRLDDLVRLYERPKTRKDLSYENYTIEDALQGLTVTQNYTKEKIVGPDAAIPRLQQQVAIVKAAKKRFESSLFDIRQLVQADLFDSELDAAAHLLKSNFGRAAGALAGVVIERHLGEVAVRHKVVVKRKDPTIAELNDPLKAAEIIDVATWRFIQHLADIRNLCDHSKSKEPTSDQVQDLLDGAMKLVKTVF